MRIRGQRLASFAVGIAVTLIALSGTPTPTGAQITPVVPDGTTTPTPAGDGSSPVEPTPSGAPAPDASPPPDAPATSVAPTMPTTDEDTQPDAAAADEVVVREDEAPDLHGGGGRNVVMVRNRADGDLRVRGRIRLVKVNGPNAAPRNEAYALASCANCQTFAIALQIALVGRDATVLAPLNRAVAYNVACESCATVARALQYVYVVDDPTDVPDNLQRLLREMERELREIGQDRHIGVAEAESRVNAVVGSFTELAQSLDDRRDEAHDRTSPGAPPLAPSPVASPPAP